MKCSCCCKEISMAAMNRGYVARDGKPVLGVYECKCGAVLGECYKGESYRIVLPQMSSRTAMEDAKYYDLTTLGSKGIERRHGWFDPKTGLILQVG